MSNVFLDGPEYSRSRRSWCKALKAFVSVVAVMTRVRVCCMFEFDSCVEVSRTATVCAVV